MTWRWRVFVATGLSYTFYYFTRKPFYVAKASMGRALDLDAAALGTLGSLYLIAYALGQLCRAGPELAGARVGWSWREWLSRWPAIWPWP